MAASVGVFLLATLLEFVVAIGRQVADRRTPEAGPLSAVGPDLFPLVAGATGWSTPAPTYLLSGSSLYAWWLRALGAKVGRDVVIGSITLRAPDLLDIGDGASIGNAVNFENARVERGELRAGPHRASADDACVGSYAVLEGDTVVGDCGHLDGQSALRRRHEGAGRARLGRLAGARHRRVRPVDAAAAAPRVSSARLAGEAAFFVCGALLVAMLFFLPVFPTFMLIDWLDEPGRFTWLQSDNVPLQLARYFLLALPAARC